MRAFTKAIACALLGALLARTAAATGRQLRSANKTRDGHDHDHDHEHGHGHSGVSCASAACKAAFQTVLMAHDSCNDEELPPLLETQLHFYEEACEAQLCNTIDAPYDLATQAAACDDDHDDDDHDNGHHHEPCVCVASAYGFEIDCSKPEVVDTAMAYLALYNRAMMTARAGAVVLRQLDSTGVVAQLVMPYLVPKVRDLLKDFPCKEEDVGLFMVNVHLGEYAKIYYVHNKDGDNMHPEDGEAFYEDDYEGAYLCAYFLSTSLKITARYMTNPREGYIPDLPHGWEVRAMSGDATYR